MQQHHHRHHHHRHPQFLLLQTSYDMIAKQHRSFRSYYWIYWNSNWFSLFGSSGCLIVYFWNLSLSLPNDLNRNPLKTRIPANAEATMVCSWGISITNVTTNVMAAAIEPSGIHTLTASADLFPGEVIHHVILIYFYTMGQPSNNEILWRTSVEHVVLRKIRHVELVFVDPSSNPCPWWLGRR